MLVELLPFVNLCFTNGIKFYYSNKFIIVSPGDEDGCLLPKYFSKAINLRSGELTIIYFAEQIHCNRAYIILAKYECFNSCRYVAMHWTQLHNFV